MKESNADKDNRKNTVYKEDTVNKGDTANKEDTRCKKDTKSKENKVPEEGVGRLLKEVAVTLQRNRDRNLACLDLTSAQIDVLLFLVCHGDQEMNQRAIEHEFCLTNPTVTGILNRLEKKGFIIRTISPHDRRNRLILLTPKAKSMQEDVMESRKYVEQLLTKGMTKVEVNVLRDLLKIMRTNLINDRKD